MALQKRSISIDLTKGADTKQNTLITEQFHEMENVVFSGDMVAKKCPGYDLVSTMTDVADLSIMAKRGSDVITQTSSGTYKYRTDIGAFSQIGLIGSASAETSDSFGDIIACGTNYNAYMKIVWSQVTVSNQPSNGNLLGVWTFTDKNGGFISNFTFSLGSPLSVIEKYWNKWSKGVAIGDVFYFTGPSYDGNSLTLFQFSLVSGFYTKTSQYVWNSTYTTGHTNVNYGLIGSSTTSLYAFDMISDQSKVYLALKTPSAQKLYSFTGTSTSGVLDSTASTIAETINSNLELHNCDSTYVYMSASTMSGATSSLYLRKYLKSSLAYSSQSLITTRTTGFGSRGGDLAWITYPLTDTTAITIQLSVTYTVDKGTTPGYGSLIIKYGSLIGLSPSEGLIPIGKIFSYNGKYYLFAMQCLGTKRRFVVVDTSYLLPISIFNQTETEYWYSTYSNNKLSSKYSTSTSEFIFPGFYAIQEQYINNGSYLLGSFDDQGKYSQTNFSFNTNTNQSTEVASKLFISGSTPQYCDGVACYEHDLIGEPFISNVQPSSGGGLIAGNYSMVAVFQWKDASGNVFNSGLSNTVGPDYIDVTGAKNVGIPVTASQKLTGEIFMPLATIRNASEIVCKIYIVNWLSADHSALQLALVIPYMASETSTAFTISNNPDALAEQLYTGSFGSYASSMETLPASSMKASCLYADSIAYIANGDNNAIYFSTKKVEGYSFGFNEAYTRLSVYDKRGFNEDKLVGLHAMDGRLFIFKNNSILYTTGSGVNDLGGNDFISPQLVTTDVGCISNRSIVLSPNGIMFMSDKGIYLLDRKLIVSYIGSQVERFNSETVTSSILLEKKNEVRFTTQSGYVLVYNYFSGQWSWITNLPTTSALMVNGSFSILDSAGRYLVESQLHNKLITDPIIQKISSPWIVQNAKQGWEKVYDLVFMGKYKSQHQFKISFYYDYRDYADYVYQVDPLDELQYNKIIPPSVNSTQKGLQFDGVYQLLFDLPIKNCQAFRFVVEDIPLDITNNTGECFEIANFTITYGIKKGPAKIPTAKTY